MAGEGEFFENFKQNIYHSLYDSLYERCTNAFEGMFDSLNNRIVSTSTQLTTAPKDWSPDGFMIIKNAAENICIPIAACIITFIFCWEIIHMVQDSNRMHNIKPEEIMMQLLKLALCLFACSKSFDIVMGFYDIGAWAMARLSNGTTGTFGAGLVLSDILPPATEPLTLSIILEMLGNWTVLSIGKMATLICSAVIYIRVVLWFLELLMYSSTAPIPFATFGNREWSQVGMNYTRKMLAICFEGFFMLLAFALYGGVVSGISGDFMESLILIIGCGFALIMLMFKAGNISASVFNAH